VLGAGDVIRGWEEGLVGMRVGGRRQLIIPSRLGYGATGSGTIPPNSILVFTIDLVSIG
jgi:peptidylprolyl isomerase